jgi:Ca2+-binding EF-hand superfamily protein
MSGKPSDDQLRQAIEAIFAKYDADKSGTLEGNEIFSLINDAFKSLGRQRQVKEEEVNQFIKAIDKNGDSKISKHELFEILKKLISGSS